MSSSLRVAIVHHHLRRGGVTRVVRHILDALAPHPVEAAVLVGEPPEDPLPDGARVEIVEGLGYSDAPAGEKPPKLAAALREAARRALGAQPALWHIHNASLGKNPAVTAAVALLAGDGERLLLQPHDFAEDGRPRNYRRLLDGLGGARGLRETLYPLGPHVHYAFLNRRDRRFFQEAGAPAQTLHALPNAIDLAGEEEVEPARLTEAGRRLVLYPTRAIRRKNLGEFLFWAARAGDGTRFAVTLAPQNPEQRPVYEAWVDFAREAELPVAFELGRSVDAPFGAVLRGADAAITTSVGEGFGLAFLEPWGMEQRLVGRNLPEITADFDVAGLDLSNLYRRLDVPLAWVGEEALRARIASGLETSWRAYGREPDAAAREAAWRAAVVDGRVDVARLDEELQREAIRAVLAHGDAEVSPAQLDLDEADVRVAPNRRVVRKEFGLARYGERLAELYAEVARTEAGRVAPLDPEALLARFLAPERFCLLLT